MASPESISQETQVTGDKSKKYDRQLRLWGDHGQAALEAARVCLINATATGTEILKNLILPGVGSFTIIDDQKVAQEDLGNNFFLDSDSIGKSRAQLTTELLLELNEDVSGDYVEDRAEDLLSNNPAFFKGFSLVIATSMPERTLLQLSGVLWEQNTPFMVCTSYGLTGTLRLQIKQHVIVESHPDNYHEDLRLDRPFPGLVKYCDSLDLESMSKKDHSHTPWLVLIYKYLQVFKSQHGGQAPKNYREKNELKEILRSSIRRNQEGVPEEEENFDEAIRNVNTALVPTKVPDDVQKIFNSDDCVNLTAESEPFWILARAVKEFVCREGEGALPVRGSIPDMTADSERYIRLQEVYREQAQRDLSQVTSHVHAILQSLGRTPEGTSDRDISVFCKNAAFLRVLHCHSIQDEYVHTSASMAQLSYQLEDEDSDLIHYIMMRAVSHFHADYSRYPGCYQGSVEGDIPKLKACVARLLQDWGLGALAIKDDYVQEYCRYGGCELHSVAAYMGGVAAQEAIKVMTQQFVPISNTYIYNATKQTSITLQL